MTRTIEQIYSDAKIDNISVNYHLYFDKSKMTGAEFFKLFNYLKPRLVSFDEKNNTFDFYYVSQRRELKLLLK